MTFWGPVLWWGIAASIPAVTAEYLFRRLPGEWHDHWYLYVPLSVAISYAMFHLIRQPGVTLLDGLIVFAFSNMVCRLFVTIYLLGDPVKGGTWFALGLLIMARIAQTTWGK